MPQKQAKGQPQGQAKTQVARAGAATTPAAAGRKVRVWLYSARSEREAIGYLREVEADYAGLMTGIDGAVMPVQYEDEDIYYRVVAGGFPTWDAGHAWCTALKKDTPDTFCKVLPTPGTGN